MTSGSGSADRSAAPADALDGGSAGSGAGESGSARRAGHGAAPLEPLLPTRSDDDSDRGWGDRASDGEDDRLLREVPPHW